MTARAASPIRLLATEARYSRHARQNGGRLPPSRVVFGFACLRPAAQPPPDHADIVVPEATGLMVALDNITHAPRADVLLDVLARASRWRLLFGRIFGVLARADDAEYTPPRIGSMRPYRRW